jgi:2,6-dioxo-6-phenylhexa-3-enoate hydrolase
LLLWGREDAVTPLEHGERLVAELPQAELRVFPRCGHFPMIEARNASNRALVRFLAEPAQ